MLELRNISKEYKTGAETVHALRNVDLAFRKSEFVSILGPSGCGKTTMLNILGGLDQYTSGDLVIDGISTKEYKAADWDAYRNDTIGFVFQSYNLISHQTVLANVELALTLSGVSAAERRRRAVEALEQVGLGDQINKKPAQMSGGQVQRVAIARALINDPDIILADEPTGALDSETSLQVMSILKNISADKLVIMVTHNPELAEAYSTRIVRLSDGQVISDSNPFVPGTEPAPVSAGLTPETASAAAAAAVTQAVTAPEPETAAVHTVSAAAPAPRLSGRARRRRNKSMSMRTALQLSLNNLMTKKARTLLTAFAGSIGIIGIALILSVSNGFQQYIDKLEEDTLSSYPLTIQSETADMTSMITAFAAAEASEDEEKPKSDIIREQQVMSEMLGSIGSNDLKTFKEYLESKADTIDPWFNYYEFSYGISPTIYSTDMTHGVLRVSPGSIMQSYMNSIQTAMISYANTDVFFQMMDNRELLQSQYKVLAGKWPDTYDELLLVLQTEDQLNDYIVYTLGLRDPQELKDMINEVMKGNEVKVEHEPLEWTYDDFVGKEFALVNPCDTFRRNTEYNVWEDMSDDDDFMEDLIRNGERLHISGIVCPVDPNGANSMSMGIGYLPSLTKHMIDYAAESEIVKIQKAKKGTDVFSGKTFESLKNKTDEGLTFGDMISIDEDKLRKALGGDIDLSAVERAIRKTGDDEFQGLVNMDSAEKIEEDVTNAVTEGCRNILNDIIKEAEKNPESFKMSEALITRAYASNMDTGKHKAIVNPLLQGYTKVLMASSEQVNAAIAAGTAAQQQQQQQKPSAPAQQPDQPSGQQEQNQQQDQSQPQDATPAQQPEQSSEPADQNQQNETPAQQPDQPSDQTDQNQQQDQGQQQDETPAQQPEQPSDQTDQNQQQDQTQQQDETPAQQPDQPSEPADQNQSQSLTIIPASATVSTVTLMPTAYAAYAIDPAQVAGALAQAGIPVTEEQAAQIISQGADADTLIEMAKASGVTLSREQAAMMAQQINQALASSSGGNSPGGSSSGSTPSGGSSSGSTPSGSSSPGSSTPSGSSSSGGSSSGGTPSGGNSVPGSAAVPQTQMSLAQMLESGLSPTIDAYVGSDAVKNGIREYSQGIEKMQIAQEVYPALGKVAQTIGSQFNIDPSGIADAFTMKMDEDEITRLITAYMSGDSGSSYEANMRKLGYADLDNPVAVAFYLKDFDSKEAFLRFIDDYNKDMQDAGDDDLVISYTDITGVMMKSVKTITNAVSYVLIAFVAISLIVSSIMIGVITYISVLERTKEIGILRAIGASRRDISRIFNAETIIVGLCAGLIGIGASLILLIPINKILLDLTGIVSLKAVLPPAGGVILILISIFLTFIAGLIPSGMAARKDPVVALRTE